MYCVLYSPHYIIFTMLCIYYLCVGLITLNGVIVYLYPLIPSAELFSNISIGDFSLYSILEFLHCYINSDAIIGENIGFKAVPDTDNIAYFTTPGDNGGGNPGTGSNNQGSSASTGATTDTTGTTNTTGATNTSATGRPRGLRTDGITGIDFSNREDMDKSISTHPCQGNNNQPHK